VGRSGQKWAEVAEMGATRPASLSSGGLRGPSATQVADYAGAAYPLRGSNPNFANEKPDSA